MKDCVNPEISRTPEAPTNPAAYPHTDRNRATQGTGATQHHFVYKHNIKFLEKIKQGFKRIVSWNKYRSEKATQPKNNLDYMIDPTFRNINMLFVLSFKNGDNDPTRDSFDEY